MLHSVKLLTWSRLHAVVVVVELIIGISVEEYGDMMVTMVKKSQLDTQVKKMPWFWDSIFCKSFTQWINHHFENVCWRTFGTELLCHLLECFKLVWGRLFEYLTQTNITTGLGLDLKNPPSFQFANTKIFFLFLKLFVSKNFLRHSTNAF